MNFLQRLGRQAADFWNGLSGVRRALLAAAAAGALLAVGLVVYLTPGVTYVPLYSELAADEAGAIDTRLTTLGIPHRLDLGGTRITVPEDRVAAARVGLAAEGLPRAGGKGYELFDETSLGTTPFVQNVNYQRALQAELGRSITSLEPVQSARVLIAKPEPTPFLRDQRPPTASVVIRLKPKAVLSRSAADGIVSLVARSVDGLKPEHVTVVDQNGRLLSDPHAGQRDDLPAPQLEYRRELETYLANKAEEMLGRHLGPGRAVVKVSADVNFQKVKERRETYSPEDKAVAAERLTTTKTTASPARGVAGAASNVSRAGGVPSGGSNSSGNSSEEVVQTDYLVSRSVRDLEDRMGAVTRLTIAVLADLAPGGEGVPPPISVADAEEMVKQALGFRSGRDEIKITNAKLIAPPSATEPEDAEAVTIRRLQAYVLLARNISLALAVVLALAVPLLLFLRRRKPAAPAVPPEEERRKVMLDRFAEMARSDPERLAKAFAALMGPPAVRA